MSTLQTLLIKGCIIYYYHHYYYFLIADIIEEFPEEIRPYKAAEFDKIIPASIKTSVTDAVQLKQTLRTYLDIYATEEQDEQLQKGTECAGSEESKLIEELKWKHTEMGPVLT